MSARRRQVTSRQNSRCPEELGAVVLVKGELCSSRSHRDSDCTPTSGSEAAPHCKVAPFQGTQGSKDPKALAVCNIGELGSLGLSENWVPLNALVNNFPYQNGFMGLQAAEFLLPRLYLCSLLRLIDIDPPRGHPPMRHRGHRSNDRVGVILRDWWCHTPGRTHRSETS
eukprot:s196_g6.t1